MNEQALLHRGGQYLPIKVQQVIETAPGLTSATLRTREALEQLIDENRLLLQARKEHRESLTPLPFPYLWREHA